MSGSQDDEFKANPRLQIHFLNGIKSFVHSMNVKGSYIAADELNEQYGRLRETALQLFPKDEVIIFVPPSKSTRSPYESESRVAFMDLFSRSLIFLSYVEGKTGNPIAQEYLSDALTEAEKALKAGYIPCAAIMTRVALEQALKTLCGMKNVDIKKDKPTAGDYAKALYDADIFREFYWRKVQSKISFLSSPAHNEEKPAADDVQKHIEWVANFIDNNLSGNGKHERKIVIDQ